LVDVTLVTLLELVVRFIGSDMLRLLLIEAAAKD
jgi:hypothetical protein